MAQYSKLVITSKGQALVAKMIAGAGDVEFSKIAISSTQYNESDLTALTSLSGIVQTALISKVSRTNTTSVQVEAAVTNEQLTSGYYGRTIGLYAVDPDDGEILYGAAIETSGSCYMPPYNGVGISAMYLKIITTVGNASSISMTVDSGAYATVGDVKELESEIADLQGFIGISGNDIYGVEVDFANKKFSRLAAATSMTAGEDFDAVTPWGGRKRCNLTNAGKVVAYYGDAGFSTTGALTTAVDLNPSDAETKDPALQFAVGTQVQVMVEQPKFYYKVVPIKLEPQSLGKGYITRKARYYVSPTPHAGFKLHPAFIKDGGEMDKIYLSAFEGSLYDASASAYILDDSQIMDASADMLSSIANAQPASGSTQNLTRANIRKLAQNRGAGWDQELVQTFSMDELLFVIEYASFDAQRKIGRGNCDKAWKEDGVNYAEVTGATVNLGNASGEVKNGNNVSMVSYRGEENLWANIWKRMDGINRYLKDGLNKIYIADHGFADDIGTDPYTEIGAYACNTEGYVSAFVYDEEFDWLFLPGETKGNDSLPVGNYFYNNQNNIGWTVGASGGSWSNGSRCGFYWDLYHASSRRSRDFGGRLVYRPDPVTKIPTAA